MSITKETVQAFRKDFEKAMKELSEKHQLTVSLGTIRYDDKHLTGKITAYDTSNVGETVSNKATEFEAKAKIIGVDPTWYGRRFSSNGKMFTICNIKPSNRKYPIIAETSTGTSYKFPIKQVERHLV